MKKNLDALERANAEEPNNLGAELESASDEYSRVVRELKMNFAH